MPAIMFRNKWFRASAQLLALSAAFHQAFLDFGPSVIAPAAALFRFIQWSFVFSLLWFVLISLGSKAPAAPAAQNFDEDHGNGAVAVMFVLAFLIAPLIAWINYEETAQLLCVRLVFVFLPKGACLMLIVGLLKEVFTNAFRDLSLY